MNQEEARQVAIGDRMWLVEQRGRRMEGRYVTVSKIGTRWVSLVDAERPTHGAGRFDKMTGDYDNGGFGSRSAIYASQEEHVASIALAEAWMKFSRLIRDSWSMPKHLSLADVQTMTAMLQGVRP